MTSDNNGRKKDNIEWIDIQCNAPPKTSQPDTENEIRRGFFKYSFNEIDGVDDGI